MSPFVAAAGSLAGTNRAHQSLALLRILARGSPRGGVQATETDRRAALKLAMKLHNLVEEDLGVELTPEAAVLIEKRFVEALLEPMCNVFRYARKAKRKWK